MPEILAALAERVFHEGWVEQPLDRCLINDYLPGQGIAAHVDYDRFGDEVVMISLLDEYPMAFAEVDGEGRFEQWLARRSICVIKGPARHAWTHEIARRFSDPQPGGGRRQRRRRISITYRRSLENG